MIRDSSKVALWAVVLAAAGIGAWLVFRTPPIRCEIAVVSRGPLVVTVDREGRTRLKDRYVVSAPLAGFADRIVLRPGDSVVANETALVHIAPVEPALLDDRARAEAEARVLAASAAADRAIPEAAAAQARLNHARVQYGHVADAAGSGAGTTKEVEDAALELRTSDHAYTAAQFSMAIARFELEQARAALVQASGMSAGAKASDDRYIVRSPITGKVLRLIHESAGVVEPGEPLLEIGSLDALEVEVDVLSEQAVRVRPGARVAIVDWGGDIALSGSVRLVEPSGFTKISALGVEEQRVNVIIDFLTPLREREALGDNFRVRALITVWESPDAVLVPVGALFRDGDAWGAFVAEGGHATLRRVVIGERSSTHADILRGLAVGERVILYPSDQVRPGARIRAE